MHVVVDKDGPRIMSGMTAVAQPPVQGRGIYDPTEPARLSRVHPETPSFCRRSRPSSTLRISSAPSLDRSTSFKPGSQVFRTPLDAVPTPAAEPLQTRHADSLLALIPQLEIVAVPLGVGTVVSSVAHAFARKRGPGLLWLFLLVLDGIMLPGGVTLVRPQQAVQRS